MRTKGTKIRSRGTDSPLTNPFLSLAVLDTNLDFSGAKNPNPYCAQIRSQGSRRRICPLPVPLPRSGGGAVWANSCLFKFRSRQRDFLRLTPRQIAVLAALRCPKKSSRCSLARFFRPLRMLLLAASATGGARLRIPIHRDPSPLQNIIINPSCTSPVKSTIYANTTHKSPIL